MTFGELCLLGFLLGLMLVVGSYDEDDDGRGGPWGGAGGEA